MSTYIYCTNIFFKNGYNVDKDYLLFKNENWGNNSETMIICKNVVSSLVCDKYLGIVLSSY